MNKKLVTIISILLAGILLVITFTAYGFKTQPPTSIYGQWQGIYDGDEFVMVFEQDGTVALSYLGSEYIGTFILDETTKPMHLDLTFYDLGNIQTIIEFGNENALRFENNTADVERPTAFSDFVILTRGK